MTRSERRKARRSIFAKHNAKYHAGYFKGTREPQQRTPEAEAMEACRERGLG
jgi:hypothetical protein